jgi:hypothetical protein
MRWERIPMRTSGEIAKIVEVMKFMEAFKCVTRHISSFLWFGIDLLNIESKKNFLSVRFVDRDCAQTPQINSFGHKSHSKIRERILDCGSVRYFPFRTASLSKK